MKEENIKITDLKDMLEKTGKIYGDKPAYKIRISDGEYKIFTHKEVRYMIDALGTALIDLGLKGRRIAVIGENRYEWEIAYLAITCGTGTVVPLDRSLPDNELKSLIERSEVEAIFFTEKYEERIQRIILTNTGKLKHLISMDRKIHSEGIYSETELIEKGKELLKNGDRSFIDEKIDPEEMLIMLFTSGTTSKSKVVALCHRNLCANLMDLAEALDVDSNDRMLSFLPLHHVFECTVGFLFSQYKGSQTSFCDGIKYILKNLNEYQITYAAFVPAIYENIYKNIMKKLEKQGKLEEIKTLMKEYKNSTLEEKKKVFKEIHEMFGGNIKTLISGAAAIDKKVVEELRNVGINLYQGYGLTETSPIVSIETSNENRIGSIGKTLKHVEAKVVDTDSEGIGELVVKGPSVMLGYFQNEKATKEAIIGGWLHTGDLATIDEDGYIFIKGRKKSVIILKNGKNIFPEEMECLVNKIEGVKESFIFGKPVADDKNDIKINVKIVYDEEIIKSVYKANTEEEIYEALSKKIKEINRIMPPYKAIRGMIITKEPLIKTTTSKIKRQEELKTIQDL